MGLTELVARAICKANSSTDEALWWNGTTDKFIDEHWTGYIADAEAAISVIKDVKIELFLSVSE